VPLVVARLTLASSVLLLSCSAAHDRASSDAGGASSHVAITDAARDGDGSDADLEGGASLIHVVGPTPIQVDAALPPSARVLAEAQALLAAATTTTYTHDCLIDESTGTFDIDCSGFVDFILGEVLPPAFAALASATTSRPYAFDYVSFIGSLPPAGTGSWHVVTQAMSLVPGDIISWLEPAVLDSVDTGHVMIVAGAPVMGSTAASAEADILVIDAASTGHGLMDKRTIDMTSGVGEGTVALTIDSNGAATGYRWSTETSSLPFATTVALAHFE
jgi:hypothetical protein